MTRAPEMVKAVLWCVWVLDPTFNPKQRLLMAMTWQLKVGVNLTSVCICCLLLQAPVHLWTWLTSRQTSARHHAISIWHSGWNPTHIHDTTSCSQGFKAGVATYS